MRQVYDVCHNVAKIERHKVGGRGKGGLHPPQGRDAELRAGPAARFPRTYRAVGQPVIIPGSMGTASYILVGTLEAEGLSFSSTAHGAGRVMSRHEAIRRFRGEQIRDDLAEEGYRAAVHELEGRGRRSLGRLQGCGRGGARLPRSRPGAAGGQGRPRGRDEGISLLIFAKKADQDGYSRGRASYNSGGRRDLGRIFFMTFFQSGWEVRMNSAAPGTSDAFRVARPRAQAVLDVS